MAATRSLPKNKSLKPPGTKPTQVDRKPKPNNQTKGMPKKFGAIGGYKGVSTKYVSKLVNGLLNQQLNDLHMQERQVVQDSHNASRDANQRYERGVGDLNYVHGETGDYIGALNQKNALTYTNAHGQVDAANNTLQRQLGDTYSGAQQDAQSELARLGISGGGNMGQLIADQANAQAMGGQAGANAQSSLSMAGANSEAAMQMLSGMNQGSFMQGIGQNLNTRQTALSDIKMNKLQAMDDIHQAMVDAKGTRKDSIMQLLQQLQQTGWSQYLQQQQLHDSRAAQHKFNNHNSSSHHSSSSHKSSSPKKHKSSPKKHHKK